MVRMSREHSALVLIDYQPRLMPVIHDGERVAARAERLAEIAQVLDVPVVGTQQSPDKLGPLVPAVAGRCTQVLSKTSFGACDDGLGQMLRQTRPGLSQVVVAGCETHVCLLQSALGLLAEGLDVFVVEDASGSRDPRARHLALHRLRQAGAVIVDVEMAAFEWVRDANHPQFRAVSALIR